METYHSYMNDNRGRTYSESSSSTTGGHPNRVRADTGDSTLSSDTTNSKGSRRKRSHRPRGCRGGRKNKRKNKVPAEILGPGSSTSALPPPSSNAPSVLTARHASYANLVDHVVPPPVESLSNGVPPAQISSYHRCNGIILPTHHHNSTSLGNPTTCMKTPFTYSANSNSSTTKKYTSTYMLDPVGDSVNSKIRESTCSAGTTTNRSTAASVGSILPPLPTLAKAPDNVCRPGPNPYALTKPTGLPFLLPQDNVENHGPLGPTVETSLHNHAYVGGSLFAVSPRSFLMGGPAP